MLPAIVALLSASPASSAQPPAPTPAQQLASLDEARRGQVRCVMLANLIASELARGVERKSYGLNGAKANGYAAALARTLSAENGWPVETVRAVYKQAFEEFAAAALAEDPPAQEPEKLLAAEIGACRPVYSALAGTD